MPSPNLDLKIEKPSQSASRNKLKNQVGLAYRLIGFQINFKILPLVLNYCLSSVPNFEKLQSE